PVAQVIHRALVAGELPAVEVRNVTDQLAPGEVPVHPERRQVVGIRTTYPLRSRGVELPLTQVRIRRPVGGLVVLVLLLEKDAGRTGDARARLPRGRQARHVRVRIIDVVVDDRASARIGAVHPAAVVAVPDAPANAEYA